MNKNINHDKVSLKELSRWKRWRREGISIPEIARKAGRSEDGIYRALLRDQTKKKDEVECSECGREGTGNQPTQYIDQIPFCVECGALEWRRRNVLEGVERD